MKLLKYIRNIKQKILSEQTIKQRTKYWECIYQQNISTRQLSKKQIREIDLFYEPYKKKVNTLYHDFYTQKTGVFCKNYIPDDLYYCYIDPYYNDWIAAKYIDNKCYYQWLLSDIKQPTTIAMRINKLWYINIDHQLIPASIDDVLMRINRVNCFVKQAIGSEGGHGVLYLDKELSQNEKFQKIDSLKKDIVIQEEFIQSDIMKKLNPSSVNTIRVLSLLSDEGVTIYSTIIRMGVGDSKVDNASSGGITCGVRNDGRLRAIAYAANGTKYLVHPTTNVKFDEILIPNYDKIKEMVKEIHPRFAHFRLLSWDFALDEYNDVALIEVNLKYGELDFHQLNNGPLFGDDTEIVLEEVFLNK